MVIVPLIDLYTTACDWLGAGAEIPHTGLLWFLVTSFFNGVIIELGRKIRAPQAEEEGVETYSALWGPRRAALAWLGALLLTALCAWLAAREIDFAGPVGSVLAILFIIASGTAWRFIQAPTNRRAKFIETISGLWTVIMYLSIGTIPLWLKLL
jgi:4-hydroxybenzoate polyprenyltransferase